jgi:hypothetical protein
MDSTFVVLDNGRIHYFGNGDLWSSDYSNKEPSGSFTIKDHKIWSIAPGCYHVIMVTMRGAVFGFGCFHQLDVVDPSALSGGKQGQTKWYGNFFGEAILPNTVNVSKPTEVFGAVTKSKGAATLPGGKVRQRPGAYQS